MEQGTGIEPAFTAWEAVVLPIYEPCVVVGIIADAIGKFNTFLSVLSKEAGCEKSTENLGPDGDITRFSRRGLFGKPRMAGIWGIKPAIFTNFRAAGI